MSAGLTLRRAVLGEIVTLRHVVLRPGLALATAMFPGDDEPTTRHFGAFRADTGDNVACLSLVRRPWAGEAAYQLRGMATRADHARRGIGTALLRHAEQALVAETGVRVLWCNARLPALGFYERMGWLIVSDQFEVPTVGPHRRMVRRVPAPAT
jgi:GNAT superfamily N-acetyltransferase